MALDAYIGSASFSLPPLEQWTLTAFSICNSVRILAYIPQIRKAAMDKHGADAISYTTWSLFLIAHISTIAYALVNQADAALALCFAGNALCCLAILVVAMRSKLRHLREHRLLANNFLARLPADLPEAQGQIAARECDQLARRANQQKAVQPRAQKYSA